MRFLIDEMFPPATCEPLTVLVTENVKDFVGEQSLVIVRVLKSRLRQKGMAGHLAATLDAWAQAHPDPYLGLHWPKVSPRRR